MSSQFKITLLLTVVLGVPITYFLRKVRLNHPDPELSIKSTVILPTPSDHLQSRKHLFYIKVQEVMEVIDLTLHEGKRFVKINVSDLDRKMQNSISHTIVTSLRVQGYESSTFISEGFIMVTL